MFNAIQWLCDPEHPMTSLAYKQSGVDLDAAEKTVELLKPLARKTRRPEVLDELGGFGGLFQLDCKKYREPVLVSGTDGVGTKLKLAFEMDRHDTLGIDLVAMCVNDILVHGAEPLFFLDYLACGKLRPKQIEEVVRGISEGCSQSGCALLGGETAEMPGMYASGEYDLAGFAVGVAEREKLVDGSGIEPGDLLLGLPSSGIHSNGFSLVRKIIADHRLNLDAPLPGSGETLGDALLKPTRIYVENVLNLLEHVEIKGMVHITGGGLQGNIPRMLPEGTAAELYNGVWPVPPAITFLQQTSGLSDEELFPVFNMGIGLVICFSESLLPRCKTILQQNQEECHVIGRIINGRQKVMF